MPTTSGTFCGPFDTWTSTGEPCGTCVSAAGWVLTTVPFGWSDSHRVEHRVEVGVVSAVAACSCVWPIT